MISADIFQIENNKAHSQEFSWEILASKKKVTVQRGVVWNPPAPGYGDDNSSPKCITYSALYKPNLKQVEFKCL